jgi:D-amino peptidase
MEGISGIVEWNETSSREGGAAYERARRLMTADANAAATGAFAGGATSVVINDSHGGSRNILVEDLDERVSLISGSPKFLSMMEGVPGSDVAMLVGYHSRAHSRGVMNHTYTGSLEEYRVNGQVFGEFGMNAALAGHFGVPVVLVTGDQEIAAEASELIPTVRTVIVKDAVSQLAAKLAHPKRARAAIYEAAAAVVREAAQERPQPLVVPGPVRLEMRFARSVQADAASVLPGAERTGGNSVAWVGDNYLEAYRAFRSMVALAAT